MTTSNYKVERDELVHWFVCVYKQKRKQSVRRVVKGSRVKKDDHEDSC